MDGDLQAYTSVFTAFAAVGVLFVVQLLVADVAGIRAKHEPGTAVVGDHDDFLFRAVRAHANTNESLAAFVMIALAAAALGADPVWTGRLAWAFAACRAVHMGAYYADLRTLRSAAFALGLLCIVALLAAALLAAAPCGGGS